MVKTVKSVNALLHHPAQIEGVLPTFYDARARICRDALDALKDHFGERVLPPIRSAIRLKEAPAQGKTIFEFAPESHPAQDYQQVVDRLIDGAGAAAPRRAAGERGRGDGTRGSEANSGTGSTMAARADESGLVRRACPRRRRSGRGALGRLLLASTEGNPRRDGARARKAEPKPAHYKVICISLYTKDLERLDAPRRRSSRREDHEGQPERPDSRRPSIRSISTCRAACEDGPAALEASARALQNPAMSRGRALDAEGGTGHGVGKRDAVRVQGVAGSSSSRSRRRP